MLQRRKKHTYSCCSAASRSGSRHFVVMQFSISPFAPLSCLAAIQTDPVHAHLTGNLNTAAFCSVQFKSTLKWCDDSGSWLLQGLLSRIVYHNISLTLILACVFHGTLLTHRHPRTNAQRDSEFTTDALISVKEK